MAGSANEPNPYQPPEMPAQPPLGEKPASRWLESDAFLILLVIGLAILLFLCVGCLSGAILRMLSLQED
jgi:hypothetical protein